MEVILTSVRDRGLSLRALDEAGRDGLIREGILAAAAEEEDSGLGDKENGAYLRQRYKITSAWSGMRDRWAQRKDYRFFKCPSCHTRLRVPRGKGKLNIVCRKCGTSFQRRT